MTLSERQLLIDSGWREAGGIAGYFIQPKSHRLYYGEQALKIQKAGPGPVVEVKPSPPPAITQSPIDVIPIVLLDPLSAFDPVTITGHLANSSNVTHFGKVVGLIQSDVAAGFSGSVIVLGTATNPGWSWTAGQVIYLNGTTLSSTPPATGFSQQIGIAISATVMYVDPLEPILL